MSEAAGEERPAGFFPTLAGIYVTPRRTLAAVARRPAVWAPLFAFVAAQALFNAVWLLKLDPRECGVRSLIAHLGTDDRSSLEQLWNARAYDTYGTNECGSLAAECEHQTGMHVFEDAFVLEIVDADTHAPRAPGESHL